MKRTFHEEFGKQLQGGPLLLNIGGNPLGIAGLRQVLHSLDWMSILITQEAATECKCAWMSVRSICVKGWMC